MPTILKTSRRTIIGAPTNRGDRLDYYFHRAGAATLKYLEGAVGGFSKPSKMPGYSWSIPAEKCHRGSILRQVPGTVCSGCYAHKGRYVFPAVQRALLRRWNILMDALLIPDEGLRFSSNFARLIEGKVRNGAVPYFRFYDSGDLQGADNLRLFADIARLSPGISYWLPTRETTYVRDYLRRVESGEWDPHPDNLTVRYSHPRVGQYTFRIPPEGDRPSLPGGLALSAVLRAGEVVPPGYSLCPAPNNGGECGKCRSCWNRGKDIAYTLH